MALANASRVIVFLSRGLGGSSGRFSFLGACKAAAKILNYFLLVEDYLEPDLHCWLSRLVDIVEGTW
jgi:hypothetical protein